MPSPRSGARSRTSKRIGSGSPEPLILGIDLGATKVVSGLVDARGRLVRHSGRIVHANDGPGGVIRSLVQSARACLDEESRAPVAIGVAVAAQVDPRAGTVVHAPNLGWRDVPLARRLSEELGAPVELINDARAATLAEWRFGAGRGVDDLFCLILGTGIGGSAVIGGQLPEGGAHAFGEVGHLTIEVGGRRCHCPNWGCFEAYAGGWAIAERARESVLADPTSGAELVRRAGTHETISAQTVFAAYRTGDPLAVRLVHETERYFADGVISVVNAFNPSVLLLGGGLIAGLPELVPVAESAIRARCQPPAASARVVRAGLGENAPLVGAAERARQAHVGAYSRARRSANP